jgi:uncharacterized protein (UPF0297 family)
MSVSDNQCAICLEEIQQTNNCTTPCGHHFCLQCLFQSLQANTACPLCRNELIPDSEENDEEEDDGNYEDDDDDDEDGESLEYNSDDEEDTRVNIDSVLTAFESRGYGLKDALMLLISGSMTYDPRYSREYRNQIEDDFEEIFSEIVNQKRELSDMETEDRRHTGVETAEVFAEESKPL